MKLIHYAMMTCILLFSIQSFYGDNPSTTKCTDQKNDLTADNGCVTIGLMGQLGNQLFQIATAYAYALDHNLSLTIPDLELNPRDNTPYNAKKLFLRKISSYTPTNSTTCHWNEPNFSYTSIPFCNRIHLTGYFQSEKYFKHRRQEILDLFAPPSEIKDTILNKYPFLKSEMFVVGIQIRDYRWERPLGDYHPTKNRAYYEEAMSYFPKDTLFMVSSNNPILARECTEGLSSNIIYLQGEDYIEEFYTLSFCKSFIIGNSSFGWWASWLSTAENKVIIAPDRWFSPPFDNNMIKTIYPEGCIILNH